MNVLVRNVDSLAPVALLMLLAAQPAWGSGIPGRRYKRAFGERSGL